MSMNVNSISGTNGVSLESGNMSIQMEFAKLQMELAATQKDQAQQRISEIRESQATNKKYAEAINELRTLQNVEPKGVGNIPTDPAKLNEEIAKAQQMLDNINQLKDGLSSTAVVNLDAQAYASLQELYADKDNADYSAFNDLFRGTVTIDGKTTVDNKHMLYELESGAKAMEARLQVLNAYKNVIDCGIDPSNLKSNFGKDMTEDMIKNVISMLQTKQETSGTDIQQKMVYVQDNMGQYNSYTQGANTAVSQANQTLTNLARGN